MKAIDFLKKGAMLFMLTLLVLICTDHMYALFFFLGYIICWMLPNST